MSDPADPRWGKRTVAEMRADFEWLESSDCSQLAEEAIARVAALESAVAELRKREVCVRCGHLLLAHQELAEVGRCRWETDVEGTACGCPGFDSGVGVEWACSSLWPPWTRRHVASGTYWELGGSGGGLESEDGVVVDRYLVCVLSDRLCAYVTDCGNGRWSARTTNEPLITTEHATEGEAMAAALARARK